MAGFFRVAPEQFVFTNGTDEAIQVFINTYVDDGQEVLLLRPAYAMYRSTRKWPGATVREIDYRSPTWISRWPRSGRHHAGDARHPDRESQQPDRHRSRCRRSNAFSKRAPQCGGFYGRSLFRILRRHRAGAASTTPRICS